jgi:hypothetical protein
MYFVIMDSETGNLIDSYDREDEARAAFDHIFEVEPEAADHVALVAYDESGMPVGQPVTHSATA